VRHSFHHCIFTSFLVNSIAGQLVSRVPGTIRNLSKYLQPIIEERLEKEAQYGPDWSGKPVSIQQCLPGSLLTMHQNDLISWILEYAEDYQKNIRDVMIRVLQVNFGAIHTTSMVGFFFSFVRIGPCDESIT
jgi:hypothetical protein